MKLKGLAASVAAATICPLLPKPAAAQMNMHLHRRRSSSPQLARLLPRVLAGAAGAVLFALAQAAPPPIPVRDFVRRGEFASPVLSPDGDHLIVSRRIQQDGKDVTVMVVYDLAHMRAVSTVRLPVFEVPAGYVWITDKRLAVTTAREFGSLEQPQLTGEVLAMDLDGGRQEYLYGYKQGMRRGGTVMVPDQGWGSINSVPLVPTGHFLLTENLWGLKEQNTLLYDVDSASAKRHLVTEIGKQDFDFLVGSDGRPRFAYGTDQDAEPAVFEYDDAKHGWTDLRGTQQSGFSPIALSPDDRDVYGRWARKQAPSALVRRQPDGKVTVLAEDAVGTIDLIEWGPRPSLPFAAGTSVGVPKLRYLDQGPDAKLHQLLSAQFPGSHVHFINYSRDGNKLLFSAASDRDPGAYYLFERATGKAFLLFAASPWIDPARMAERRPIHFTASDGLEIHGYLTMPTVAGDGKPALILLPHGGPHGVADDWFFDADAQFLASRGYAVLQINYRGSAGRGPDFKKAGYREWGGRIQRDLLDGVRWTIEQGRIDPDRVCAFGASFGAYASMMTAIRSPGLIKCVIGYAGVYDLPLMYREDQVIESKMLFNYLVKVVGEDPKELADNSPARLAGQLTMPVLLVHGASDLRVPPVQATTMREALTKSGRPPEWLLVDGEGHGFYSEKNRQAFYEKLEAFLAKHLAK